MDVVITLKAFGRISGQKLIKFEPDSECPSFPNTLYVKDFYILIDYQKIRSIDGSAFDILQMKK